MKRNVLEDLNFCGENTAQRLSSIAKFSEGERERVYEKSVKKYERLSDARKTENGDGEKVELVELESARPRFAVMRTAAACVAALVIGVGAFGVIRASEPPASEEITSESTRDETSGADSENEREDTASKERSESSAVSSGKRTDKQESSKAAEKPRSESAATAAEDRKSGESSSAEKTPRTEDMSGTEQEEQTSESGEDTQSKPAGVCGTGEQSEPIESEQEDQSETPGGIIGVCAKDRVLEITPDMSYREVIELLGEPDTQMMGNYAEYIVDDEYLLMFKWDYDTDPVLKSGSELLSTAGSALLYSNPENYIFDCYVVDYNGASVRVTCPKYPKFDCATVGIGDNEQARCAIEQAMSNGHPLRVTYDGMVLETYPPHITAVNIEISPDSWNYER